MSDVRGAAFIDFIIVLILIVVGLVAALFLFTSSVTGGLSNSFKAMSQSPGCIPSVTLDDCSDCGGNDKCCYCPAKCVQADKPIKAGFDCGGLAEEFAKVQDKFFACNDTCVNDFCQCTDSKGCILSKWATVKKGETCLGVEPTSFPTTELKSCTETCTDSNNCTCPTGVQGNKDVNNRENWVPMCHKTVAEQGKTCQTLPDLEVSYPGVQFSFSSAGFVRTVEVRNIGGTDFVAPFTVCFQGVSKIVDGLEAGATINVNLESSTSFGADGTYFAVVNCDPKTGGVVTTNEFNTDNNVYACKTFQPAQGVPSCT
jgi:hypothetical protein